MLSVALRVVRGEGRSAAQRSLTVLAATAVALAVAGTWPGSAQAATLTVTTAGEGTAGDGLCSLREAVLAANANGSVDSDCGKGAGADLIQLGALRYTLARSGNDDSGALGDLDVTDSLTIVGVSRTTTVIDAGQIDRVLDVKGVTVSLHRLAITGGRAPGGSPGGSVTAVSPLVAGVGLWGQPGGGGGGILNAAGTLSLADCMVSLNQAGAGGTGGNGYGASGAAGASGQTGGYGRGGYGGVGGHGGGILSTGGLLLIERTIVSDNEAGPGGAGGVGLGGNGGLATGSSGTGGAGGPGFGEQGGTGGRGGGIAATGGGLQIIDSTIEGNRAGAGGPMGDGIGGWGGPAIGTSGTGGRGGQGQDNQPYGSAGASGGEGGGVAAEASVAGTISRSLIVGNRSGDGGRGTNAEGGRGGGVTEVGRPAGTGGRGSAGNGGFGGNGGGIQWAAAGLIENSTIANNVTGTGGSGGTGIGGRGGTTTGGISNGGDASAGNAGNGGSMGGAALYGSSSAPTLRHGTVTGNSLGAAGLAGTAIPGAVGMNAGSGTSGSTYAGNAGSLGFYGAVGTDNAVVTDTIVSGNAGAQCGGVVDGGSNISFPDTSCPGANVDPQLTPLSDNGGPTRTRALAVGSPAVGGVPPAGAGCAATDQRGIPRPQGTACDIGAYEQALPLVSIGGTTGVAGTGATLLGAVTPNLLQSAQYRFEFGTTTAYGSQTSLGNVAAGVAGVPVSAAISGLAPETLYHYRLVATNGDGTSVTGDATFRTAVGAVGAAIGGGIPAAGQGTTASLAFAIRPLRRRIARGSTTRMTLRTANTGAVSARGVTACVRVPGNFTVTRAPGGSRSGGRVCFGLGDMAPGARRDRTITVRARSTSRVLRYLTGSARADNAPPVLAARRGILITG